jgi:hypothetical protein
VLFQATALDAAGGDELLQNQFATLVKVSRAMNDTSSFFCTFE